MKIQTTSALSVIAAAVIGATAITLGSGRYGAAAAATAPDGAALYSAKCSSCHKPDGTGLTGVFPALAGNADVNSKNPTTIILVTKYGKKVMPEYGDKLSNAEIAAVLTYVRSSWKNTGAPVTEKQVAAVPSPAPK